MTRASPARHIAVSNTLALPCTARFAVTAADQEQVLGAADFALSQQLPLIPVGEGSNIVLPPSLEAVVLFVGATGSRVIEDDGSSAVLRVGAGRSWHELVLASLDMGLFGLENLALIPGCVGAAPVQNIGAYGRELAEFLVAVDGVDLDTGQPRRLAASECGFAYRDSIFKHALRDRFVITSVDLRLTREPRINLSYPALRDRIATDEPTPAEVCDAVVALRRERLPDPARHPNAGSFFKNPLVSTARATRLVAAYAGMPVHAQPDGDCKLSAAWLIDYCGLRGFTLHAAAVSAQHALVIETRAGATQADVLALAERVVDSVQREFGVTLEPEPRIYA